jgi:hypothetical protein
MAGRSFFRPAFPIKLLQNVEGLLALSLIGNQTLSFAILADDRSD